MKIALAIFAAVFSIGISAAQAGDISPAYAEAVYKDFREAADRAEAAKVAAKAAGDQYVAAALAAALAAPAAKAAAKAAEAKAGAVVEATAAAAKDFAAEAAAEAATVGQINREQYDQRTLDENRRAVLGLFLVVVAVVAVLLWVFWAKVWPRRRTIASAADGAAIGAAAASIRAARSVRTRLTRFGVRATERADAAAAREAERRRRPDS